MILSQSMKRVRYLLYIKHIFSFYKVKDKIKLFSVA